MRKYETPMVEMLELAPEDLVMTGLSIDEGDGKIDSLTAANETEEI